MLPKVVEVPQEELTPLQQAMYAVADALEYPVDNHGRVYDLRYLIPLLAYHLPRAGIGPVDGLAVVKKRLLPPGEGVAEGAVEWVPLDAEDSVEDELARVTSFDDLSNLSPAARAVAIRRMGGSPETAAAANPTTDEQLDGRTPWSGVETRIHFDNEEN